MNFEPPQFFIGLMDFFTILLPGALLGPSAEAPETRRSGPRSRPCRRGRVGSFAARDAAHTGTPDRGGAPCSESCGPSGEDTAVSACKRSRSRCRSPYGSSATTSSSSSAEAVWLTTLQTSLRTTRARRSWRRDVGPDRRRGSVSHRRSSRRPALGGPRAPLAACNAPLTCGSASPTKEGWPSRHGPTDVGRGTADDGGSTRPARERATLHRLLGPARPWLERWRFGPATTVAGGSSSRDP
jgi:hypothetical protein